MRRTKSELVMNARKKDEEAITELYEMTYNRVYTSIRRVLHNDADAQDILQDSYISAFTHLDNLQDAEKFDAWLYRIAMNLCKTYLKKKKPTLFTELEGEDGTPVEFVDERDVFRPDKQADLADTVVIFDKIFDSLPEDQRLCIIMYYRDEMSVAEIAEALEIPQNTVKSRLLYGRKKIQAEVEAMEKKGVKLYSAMPFLTWMLFGQMEDSTAMANIPPAAGILTAVRTAAEKTGMAGVNFSAAGHGTSAGTAGTVAANSAKVGAVLAKVVVGKLTVGAIAAIVAGVIIVGAVTKNIVIKENPTETTLAVAEAESKPALDEPADTMTEAEYQTTGVTSADSSLISWDLSEIEITSATDGICNEQNGWMLKFIIKNRLDVKDSKYAYNIYPQNGNTEINYDQGISQSDVDNASYFYYSETYGNLSPILYDGITWRPMDEQFDSTKIAVTVVNLGTKNIERVFNILIAKNGEEYKITGIESGEVSGDEKERAYNIALDYYQSKGFAKLAKGADASVVAETTRMINDMYYLGWEAKSGLGVGPIITVYVNSHIDNPSRPGCYILYLEKESFNIIGEGWMPSEGEGRMVFTE